MFLQLSIRSDTGTVSCCQHYNACTPAACKCCQNFASIEINIIECEYISGRSSFSNVIDIDRTLLHEPFTKDMLMHDPYTPESIESHSPLPLPLSNDRNIPFDFANNNNNNSTSTHRNQSVSPTILKSRLEVILKTENDLRVPEPTDRDSKKLTKFRRCRHLTKSQSQQLDSKSANRHVDYIRTRCLSESAKKNNVRARLISSNSAQSMLRLQSHHSSSDEEWFEFEEATTTVVGKGNFFSGKQENDTHLVNEVFDEASNHLKMSNDADNLVEDNNRNIEKKNKTVKKSRCCCVL